eukprot:m.442346 g.442346  ORF g.442346 m.442346 type:complete len:410 (+) comp21475_c0_seq1:269-1498(+)
MPSGDSIKTSGDEKLRPFLAGAISGIVSRTATAPVDRVKILMQVDGAENKKAPAHTNGKMIFQYAQQQKMQHNKITFWPANAVNRRSVSPLVHVSYHTQGGANFLPHLSHRWNTATPPCYQPMADIATCSRRPLQKSCRGIFETIKFIYSDGGVRGFWRGNLANICKVAPESATKFAVYDLVKASLYRNDDSMKILDRFACGSIAGATAQLAVYPLDVTKTRLAASSTGTYQGIVHCVKSSARAEGIGALYKGLTPALLAVVPAAGVDLAVYNTMRDLYVERVERKHHQLVMKHALKNQRANTDITASSPLPVLDTAVPIHLSLAFGAVAATSGAVVAYPLTLIRTKMIAQGMPGHTVEYAGAVDCVRHVWRLNGLSGFYRGITPALLKAVPAISIGYGSYELAKTLLV